MSWQTKVEEWAKWSAEWLNRADQIPSPRFSIPNAPWFNDFLELLGEDGPPDDLRRALDAAIERENGAAARFAGLHLYHLLAVQDAYPLQDSLVDDARRIASAQYRGLVEAVAAEDVLLDRRWIDWEICLCGPMRMWDRADRLFNRLREIGGIASADVDAVHAQHVFMRCYFDDGGELANDDMIARWVWSTDRVTEPNVIASTLLILRATSFESFVAASDAPSPEYVYSEVERGQWPELLWFKSLMLARPAFELGLSREAAARMEQALADGTFPRSWRKSAYEALSRAYEQIGDSRSTEAFLQAWSYEFPADPTVLLKLAEVSADSAHYEKAYRFVRRAVELSPDLERDLGTRLGLALGEVAVENTASWTQVKTAIRAHPQIEQALEGVVQTYWGNYVQLDGAERTEWIAALYALQVLASGPTGLAPVWLRHAGVAFLTVAETQLRRRVFEPIRDEAIHDPNLMQAAKKIASGDRLEIIARFIAGGRLTLCQMLWSLEHPPNAGATQLESLLRKHLAKSPVLEELEALRRLSRPRNQAVHELQPLDGRPLHDDARRVIDAALAHSRRR